MLTPPVKKELIMLSGGPDSMALLAKTLEGVRLWGTSQLHVWVFDHQLREESAQEAKQVIEWAKELVASNPRWAAENEVCYQISTPREPINRKRLLESARNARYQSVVEYCYYHRIHDVYIGHNMTDLMETTIKNITSGGGVRGCVSMQLTSSRYGLSFHRPLLFSLKEDLEDFCLKRNIPFVKDPTNENKKFFRGKIRPLVKELKLNGYMVASHHKRMTEEFAYIQSKLAETSTKDGMRFDQTRGAISTRHTHLLNASEFEALNILKNYLRMVVPAAKLADSSIRTVLEDMRMFLLSIGHDRTSRKFNIHGCEITMDKMFMTITRNYKETPQGAFTVGGNQALLWDNRWVIINRSDMAVTITPKQGEPIIPDDYPLVEKVLLTFSQ